MLEELFNKVKTRVGEAISPAEPDTPPASRPSIPKDLMFKCPRCQNVVFRDAFAAANKVCPRCNYHARLRAAERLALTVDDGSLEELDAGLCSLNPIGFPGYSEKVAAMRAETGLTEAVVTGRCRVQGERCVVGAMDSHFMMASMGSVVGEKLARAFELATREGLPVILFTASGGARMQEGIVSLMQMAKTSAAVGRHSDAGLLYISVMTDPTTGGVAASFASLADIVIAEPKVLIGFAGRRVIESTIRQRLPDDFQSAEFFLEHGFVDLIAERAAMRATLGRLLRLHRREGVGA